MLNIFLYKFSNVTNEGANETSLFEKSFTNSIILISSIIMNISWIKMNNFKKIYIQNFEFSMKKKTFGCNIAPY